MAKRILAVLLGLVAAGCLASPVVADTIASSHLIQVRQFENLVPPPSPFYNQLSTGASASHTFPSVHGSDIQGYGNLATGMTGVRNDAPAQPSNSQSSIKLFDTLTFSQASTVSYKINFAGSLSNSGTNPFEGANASYTATIYDITGMTTWLQSLGSIDPIIIPAPGATAVSETEIRFIVGTQELVTAYAGFSPDANIVDTSGTTHLFDLDKTDSFVADPSKTYGIQIFAQAGTTGPSTADFLNAGAFEFMDLDGATFTSGSGVFLSEQSAEVPLPASLLLFGSGLAGLPVIRRKLKIKTG